MKYYSEKLDQLFNSEKELLDSEIKYDLQQAAKAKEAEARELAEKEKAASISKEKKLLSKAIEEAENKLNQAYADYEIAQESVRKLTEEYNKKVADILNPAKKAIDTAQINKFDAVAKFNQKFGAYTTVVDKDKTLQELKRMNFWANDIFRFLF